MTIWFTSDTHYHHRNIIKYSNRPFLVEGDTHENISRASVAYMNEQLIERHNSLVQPDDDVYHLGDFSFARDPEQAHSVLKRLNGRKHLILGNHDEENPWVAEFPEWEWVKQLHEFTVREGRHTGTRIILCHYAMRVWHHSYRENCIMLYGHSHGGLPGTRKSLDVGVDCWNWYPVNLDDIKRRLATLPESREHGHHTD